MYTAQRRKAYWKLRARLAHPADRTMCASCGVREHTAIHHKGGFRRAGVVSSTRCMHELCSCTDYCLLDLTVSLDALPVVQVCTPSAMRPPALAAEVARCTRADGSIGLASLCSICHRDADRSEILSRTTTLLKVAKRRRNIRLDVAAKIARGECECNDESCHRVVTTADVGMLEWDHVVQSFDNPHYRAVSWLVSNGASPRAVLRRGPSAGYCMCYATKYILPSRTAVCMQSVFKFAESEADYLSMSLRIYLLSYRSLASSDWCTSSSAMDPWPQRSFPCGREGSPLAADGRC